MARLHFYGWNAINAGCLDEFFREDAAYKDEGEDVLIELYVQTAQDGDGYEWYVADLNNGFYIAEGVADTIGTAMKEAEKATADLYAR